MARVGVVRARVELQMLGEILADAEDRRITVSDWLREACESKLRAADPGVRVSRDIIGPVTGSLVDVIDRAGVEARKQAWLDRQNQRHAHWLRPFDQTSNVP